MPLEDVFHEALADFLAHEYALVRKDAHEQSLCGRLAIYMDRAKDRHGYERYYVDVEYNRRGEGRKQILHPLTGKHIDVTCDLLLHSRGDLDDDNQIAVEMKKDYATNKKKRSDRERLQALTLPMPETWITFVGTSSATIWKPTSGIGRCSLKSIAEEK